MKLIYFLLNIYFIHNILSNSFDQFSTLLFNFNFISSFQLDIYFKSTSLRIVKCLSGIF